VIHRFDVLGRGQAPIYDLSDIEDWSTVMIWRRGAWHSIRLVLAEGAHVEPTDVGALVRLRAQGRVALPQMETELAEAVAIHERAIEQVSLQGDGLTYTSLEVIDVGSTVLPPRIRIGMFVCTEDGYAQGQGIDRPSWFATGWLGNSGRFTSWSRILNGLSELDEAGGHC
jgi:hypothetical protein